MSPLEKIEPLYSEILPGLWQGGTADSETVDQPKKLPNMNYNEPWDAVVTLYAHAQPMGWGVSELRFGFPDASLEAKIIPDLLSLSQWAHGQWEQGKKTLIRCQAGWNRSGLVMALVLMREEYSAQDAIELIREKRSPNALCNSDFVEFLHMHELLKKIS